MDEDETGVANTVYDAHDTAIVPGVLPSAPDLAWSDPRNADDLNMEITASGRGHSIALWAIALAAVSTAGLTAAWFAVTLFRNDQAPTSQQPTPHVAAPIVAPPTEDPPHAPAQNPWMAFAVGSDVLPGGKRAFGYGFGLTEDAATQGALNTCRAIDRHECTRVSAAVDACIAVAVDPGGAYVTSLGPSREAATTTAKSNLPQADRVRAFCSWDGNGAPTAGP